MQGALPHFMLIPSPDPLKHRPAKVEIPVSYKVRRIMKAKFHIALAAIACGVALTTPATADQNDGEQLTKIVSYADLNLNGEAGARTLHGRLRMAAAQVCAPFRGTTLREKAKYRECVNPALASSVAKVDEPMLTAYHLSRSDTTPPSRVAKDQ
jgi:UrcA family protein